ncbi:hypothetical protein F6V30_07910 [Oryzomonas sagensis]|uniref:Uncharacterized protein n=1 Tax=Oryzomonas sagensis TaxID=2603857 RepID=A0ABQ6TN81_9BACT|nr:hypothetical protein [Oryzomonas sagensis]KAB0670081.1 hypothetical protein F6V30_07910 [Oryzomonas sagensis]
MFDLEPYKHPGHKERQAPVISLEELCIKRPEERTLPYYSPVVEQLEADQAYQELSNQDQGNFMRLLPLLWRSNGLLPDFSKIITSYLRLTEDEWAAARSTLINVNLLEVSPDRCYLLNRGLRQQYLNTLDDCNGRRRKKSG